MFKLFLIFFLFNISSFNAHVVQEGDQSGNAAGPRKVFVTGPYTLFMRRAQNNRGPPPQSVMKGWLDKMRAWNIQKKISFYHHGVETEAVLFLLK